MQEMKIVLEAMTEMESVRLRGLQENIIMVGRRRIKGKILT
jgi:hypothetical protein